MLVVVQQRGDDFAFTDLGVGQAPHDRHAVLAEQHDDWIEGRRYLGLDVLARSRLTLLDDQDSEEVKDPMTSPALIA